MTGHMIPVRLNWNEARIAADVGIRRHLAALRDGRHDSYGADPDNGWTLHVEGAGGEMAYAKATGQYWDGSVDTFKSPDVGPVHVRTRSRVDWDLIVRPGDPDGVYVLVLGKLPEYRVAGWISKAEAQAFPLTSYGGRARPPAYFIPQTALHGPGESRLRLVS